MSTEKPSGQTLRFFLDTEFNDEIGNCRIEPISIALVSDNGEREFYAESSEFSEEAAHPWLKLHVLPKLGPKSQRQPLDTIRNGLKTYLTDGVRASSGRVDKIQIWAKNGSNDFTLLGLLFDGLSKFYAFLNTIGIERTYFNDTDMLRRQVQTKVATESRLAEHLHHALWDARNERAEYIALQKALAAQNQQR